MKEKLVESIFTTDRYILTVAIWTIGILLVCIISAIFARIYVREHINDEDLSKKRLPEIVYVWLRVLYSLFVTLISIFPLLGMLGTVKGLLMMDFVAGNMEYMKHNFFLALTSTAWGILFSIGFKLIHAVSYIEIEASIDETEKMKLRVKALRDAKTHKV